MASYTQNNPYIQVIPNLQQVSNSQVITNYQPISTPQVITNYQSMPDSQIIENQPIINNQVIITTEDETGFFDHYFNNEGYYTIMFQIFLVFFIGMVLAPFSLGFLLFVIIYFLTELIYAYRRGFKYDNDEAIGRIAIFGWGVLGFIVGRWAIKDTNPFRHHYDEWSL